MVTRDRVLAKARLGTDTNKALQIVEVDLKGVQPALSGDFTHLIHSATPSSPRTGGLVPDYVTEVSMSGAKYLLDKARSQKSVPVIMHLSSGAVYGPQGLDNSKFLEGTQRSMNLTSLSAYALVKIQIEKLVEQADAAGIVRGANPRLFAFAGPHIALDAHFAVGNFVHDALYSEQIILKGNPRTVRSYLYPTDMASSLIACLANPTLQPLHIGSDRPMEMQEIARRISSLAGNIPVTLGDSAAAMSRYVPATAETRRYLGVEQRVSFDDGIERWMRWLKS